VLIEAAHRAEWAPVSHAGQLHDRASYRFFFLFLKIVLEDILNYKIIYVHQNDTRNFNRGAMKNIGFLYMKKEYPNDYKNMTFVFNDIDTMPYTKNFLNYETTKGIIKHFYGFKYALGGIVSINGQDFEDMNGYPNYWGWGFEDNMLQYRAKTKNIIIDRSQFYPIMDKNIMQMKDGLERLVNRGEYDRYINDIEYNNTNEGLASITNITNNFIEDTGFLNILKFNTGIDENPNLDKIHDIRQGSTPFLRNPTQRRRGRMGMIM
jgi:hypothetical protein